MPTTIMYEGHEIPIDDTIAASDELLKQALLPHLGAEIANAQVTRTTKEGQPVVTLTKRAGPKGTTTQVLEAFRQAPEYINPAFGLACMLKWNEARGTLDFQGLLDLQPVIEAALASDEREETHIKRAVSRMREAPAVTSTSIIVGF